MNHGVYMYYHCLLMYVHRFCKSFQTPEPSTILKHQLNAMFSKRSSFWLKEDQQMNYMFWFENVNILLRYICKWVEMIQYMRKCFFWIHDKIWQNRKWQNSALILCTYMYRSIYSLSISITDPWTLIFKPWWDAIILLLEI